MKKFDGEIKKKGNGKGGRKNRKEKEEKEGDIGEKKKILNFQLGGILLTGWIRSRKVKIVLLTCDKCGKSIL